MVNESEITWDELREQFKADKVVASFFLDAALERLEKSWKAKSPKLELRDVYQTSPAIKYFKHLKDLTINGFKPIEFWQETLGLPLEKLTFTRANKTTIPDEIDRLAPTLEVLELSNNTDLVLSPSIKNLGKLIYLGLAKNDITTIPDFLKYLPSSCRIELGSNPIPPEEIERFRKVVETHRQEHENEGPIVSTTYTQGLIWDDIERQLKRTGFRTLFNTDSSINKLKENWKNKEPGLILTLVESTSPALKHFTHLRDLTLLMYRANNFWTEVLNLPLEKFTIHDSSLTDLPPEIDKLAPTLEVLALRNIDNIALPESIKNLKALALLSLAYNNRITIPDVLGYLPRRCKIDFTGNSIEPGEVAKFDAFVSTIRSEYKGQGPELSLEGQETIVTWSDIEKQLRSDNFRAQAWGMNVTDATINRIKNNWQTKQSSLELSGVTQTSSALKHFTHVKNLELGLYSAVHFWNEILDLPDLEVLTVLVSGYMPPEFFPQEIDKLDHLRELKVIRVSADSDQAGIQDLPDSIKNLKHLEVLDLTNQSLSSIPSFLKYLPSNCKIILSGNRLTFSEIGLFRMTVEAHRKENPTQGPTEIKFEHAARHIDAELATVAPLEDMVLMWLSDENTSDEKKQAIKTKWKSIGEGSSDRSAFAKFLQDSFNQVRYEDGEKKGKIPPFFSETIIEHILKPIERNPNLAKDSFYEAKRALGDCQNRLIMGADDIRTINFEHELMARKELPIEESLKFDHGRFSKLKTYAYVEKLKKDGKHLSDPLETFAFLYVHWCTKRQLEGPKWMERHEDEHHGLGKGQELEGNLESFHTFMEKQELGPHIALIELRQTYDQISDNRPEQQSKETKALFADLDIAMDTYRKLQDGQGQALVEFLMDGSNAWKKYLDDILKDQIDAIKANRKELYEKHTDDFEEWKSKQTFDSSMTREDQKNATDQNNFDMSFQTIRLIEDLQTTNIKMAFTQLAVKNILLPDIRIGIEKIEDEKQKKEKELAQFTKKQEPLLKQVAQGIQTLDDYLSSNPQIRQRNITKVNSQLTQLNTIQVELTDLSDNAFRRTGKPAEYDEESIRKREHWHDKQCQAILEKINIIYAEFSELQQKKPARYSHSLRAILENVEQQNSELRSSNRVEDNALTHHAVEQQHSETKLFFSDQEEEFLHLVKSLANKQSFDAATTVALLKCLDNKDTVSHKSIVNAFAQLKLIHGDIPEAVTIGNGKCQGFSQTSTLIQDLRSKNKRGEVYYFIASNLPVAPYCALIQRNADKSLTLISTKNENIPFHDFLTNLSKPDQEKVLKSISIAKVEGIKLATSQSLAPSIPATRTARSGR